MGRTRKHANASLGMSLVKKKKTQWDRSTNCERPVLTDNTTNTLKSVTEENSYDEFIATATLANKEFTAEKLNVKFVALSTAEQGEDQFTEEDKRLVIVPRRPKWTREMTAEELDEAERETFLEWRRGMAHLQNKEGITPFERNIEVWRQLWRVVERSQVVMQIVDARHPLLYRCEDLELYVKEMGKKNILLLNKADFLSQKQKKYWSQYLHSIGLAHAFYSATLAAQHLKPEEDDILEENEQDLSEEEEEDAEHAPSDYEEQQDEEEEQDEDTKILSRQELINFLRKFNDSPESLHLKKSHEDVFAVGLVGYPNVGKSSTINSLMAAKKTSVSSTPGKTKHFQTLFLEDDILLCDCPGLVMPAFGGSKGEMVLGGILPIDQLTSYSSATDLLVQRIPEKVLERLYGVTLPKNYSHEEFLSSYAALRGFMTVRGIPDTSRASRIVLKDYVNGKVKYCHPPPNVTPEEFQSMSNIYLGEEEEEVVAARSRVNNQEGDAENVAHALRKEERRPLGQQTRMERKLDGQFFKPTPSTAHIKGVQLISTGASSSASSSSASGEGKPWKKHGNRNKKEKLRRLYRHLDVE